VEDDPTGGKFASASGMLNGAPNKLEDVVNFHVGDTITALQRSALQPGGQEVLVLSFSSSLSQVRCYSCLAAHQGAHSPPPPSCFSCIYPRHYDHFHTCQEAMRGGGGTFLEVLYIPISSAGTRV